MQFVIEGEPGEYTGQTTPISVQRVIAALDKMDDGKLLRVQGLAERSSISVASVRQCSTHPTLDAYRFKHGGGILYGNPKTIAAAKQKFQSV